jgi:hypothetical protein
VNTAKEIIARRKRRKDTIDKRVAEDSIELFVNDDFETAASMNIPTQ